MIGVIADPADHDVVCEFFELFKTPWEFYRQDRRYDVLLCAGDGQFDETAKLVVFYAGRKIDFDHDENALTGENRPRPSVVSYQGNRIPIYGDTITFPDKRNILLTAEDSRECAGYLDESGNRVLARIGYDLFREIRKLLTAGQPPANASIPTLDLHIALLRDIITGRAVPLVEIPPVPEGYQFVACLTHDVDHPSIRKHIWDHTMFGFLYRAIFGSLRKVIFGKMTIQGLLANWAAVLKLPFVYLGLAKDFWRDFDDRYLEMEKDLRSTFFVIPFANRPGSSSHGPAPAIRAAGYGAGDIADTIRKVISAGSEVGLHGTDAWLDSSKGREELGEIRHLAGTSEIGVRMHWLYFGEKSHSTLEAAGAAYDSTIGYNETVGYRAGTTQVYKPLDANHLLELPLHVMDTALFYPSYLGLSALDAKSLVGRMVDNAVRSGGTLTINWHDRSLAPERLWGEFYGDLIQELKSRGAWFATAEQATSWFRKRRSAAFVSNSVEPGPPCVKVAAKQADNLPRLQLRIHKTSKPNAFGTNPCEGYVNTPVDERIEARVPSEAGR
jgi:peptidoglycan/xylan/chitin deacetylase (PgdA/CDA1 family)